MAQYLPVKRLRKYRQYVQTCTRIQRQTIYNRKVRAVLGGDKSNRAQESSRADPPTEVLQEKDEPIATADHQDLNLPEESAVTKSILYEVLCFLCSTILKTLHVLTYFPKKDKTRKHHLSRALVWSQQAVHVDLPANSRISD